MFPLLDLPPEAAGTLGYLQGNADTITSLSNFPSWLSMPSLPSPSTPQALMAIDREPSRDMPTVIHEEEAADLGPDRPSRVRLRSHSARPKSYHQILEDFEDMDQERSDVLNLPLEEGSGEDAEEEGPGGTDFFGLTREPSNISNAPVSASSSPRREDTARRNKRFSLPAVALQTTSVTATTGFGHGESGTGVGGASQLRPNKRFSLVLGGSRHHGQGSRHHSEMAAKWGKAENDSDGKAKGELGRGVAAGKLSELLGRRKD